MNKSTARGRRSGRSQTRDTILAAARARFFADGYEAVTMRAIAAEAGVDVALVSYWFGSKKGLFAAALDLAVSPADILERALAGPDHEIAAHVVAGVVALWDDPATAGPLRAALGAAAGDPAMGRLVAVALERELVDRLAEHLGGADARGRASAFCTCISGIIFSRYILRVEPVASMAADEVVRHLAPGLQRTLDLAG